MYNLNSMESEKNENIKPSFWAVIPANVRYDKTIGSTAKLLFAEITALSNLEGYCWASNNYFANLFDITIKQVSRLIGDLERKGFVKSYVDANAGNQRRLYPQVVNDIALPVSKVKTLAERFDEQVGMVSSELSEERNDFLGYWTAKNEGGKKEHWQKQTTFAIKQRWATWLKNKRKWERPDKNLPSDKELSKQAMKEADAKARDNDFKARLDDVGKPRTKEEQDRMNRKLAEVRASLKNKFAIKV